MLKLRVLALLLLASCTTSGNVPEPPPSSEELSCAKVGDHLNATCGPLLGEDFRALCEITHLPLVSEETRRCAAELTECTEETFRACDIRSTTIGCDVDEDCPEPFACDVELEECVRCLAHDDCEPGRGCLDGLCYDMDSEFYQTFAPLFGEDAGAQD